MDIFKNWDNNIDLEGLKKDVEEAKANGNTGNYAEVPVGTYEVKVEKMELKASSKGDPMFFAQFRILTGEFQNSCLFMNQVITQGFQIGIVDNFLRSLVDRDVTFESYNQYNNLVLDIMEEVDGKLEFLLEYKKSKKDFPIYTIKEVYEL